MLGVVPRETTDRLGVRRQLRGENLVRLGRPRPSRSSISIAPIPAFTSATSTWTRCFFPQSGQVKVVQCSRAARSAASSNACWISTTESAVTCAKRGRTSAGLIAVPFAVTVVTVFLDDDRCRSARVPMLRVASGADGVLAEVGCQPFVVPGAAPAWSSRPGLGRGSHVVQQRRRGLAPGLRLRALRWQHCGCRRPCEREWPRADGSRLIACGLADADLVGSL